MKLIATIIATLAMLLGGTVAVAAPASAAECQERICAPEPTSCDGSSATGRPECPPPAVTVAEHNAALDKMYTAEQTANDYRVQVIALREQVAQQTARAERAERAANRRAATIQRLRAKIRALR